MKTKVFAYLGIAAMASMSWGCQKYLEDDVVSPNSPESVTPSLLLSNIEVSTFATYGGQLARQSGVMVQQIAGTSAGSQSVEIAEYNITELTNENEWNTIYTGALMNGRLLINEYGAESPYYAGIAKVIMAMNFGIATDLWGDVPFTDALGGLDGNLSPSYDTQESILMGIQALLDEAIADLSKPQTDNKFIPAFDDFIFEGDVAKWIKTAHVLKARYHNRLSQRDAAGSATSALADLTNAGMVAGDDCNMIFFGGTSRNQWADYEANRGGYLRVCATLVDSLVAMNDPRIPYYLAEDDNGGYTGTPFDDVDVLGTSYVGDYYASDDSPIPLVSFVESKFIEAEARLRASDAPGAATAYNDAIVASITQVTGAAPDPAYVTAYASETGTSITLEKIMKHKAYALFCQVEVYNDWRRTGFPTLTPNPNAAGGLTVIPVRLPTPQNERLYNPNATVVSDLITPVWWDN